MAADDYRPDTLLSAAEARVFRSLGWKIVYSGAFIDEEAQGRRIRRRVFHDGRWVITDAGANILAEGQDKGPCQAAMDANEWFWAFRDGQPVPNLTSLRKPA
jgi:hypothetical protein